MGKFEEYDDPNATAGVVVKTGQVGNLETTDDDMVKINRFTLEPLKAEDVFTFKVTMCDNEQDDRNNMPFNAKALKDMAKIYVGKTMICDHSRLAENQVARIYDTELVEGNAETSLGEKHLELVGKAYMLNNEANAGLIADIKAGIKKEVSTSTKPEKMICSICGTDNMQKYCSHWPGRSYTVNDAQGKAESKTCKMLLHGCADAYELSFVAVPAQPRAGITKSIGFTKPVKFEQPTPEPEPLEDTAAKDTAEAEIAVKMAAIETFMFINQNQ